MLAPSASSEAKEDELVLEVEEEEEEEEDEEEEEEGTKPCITSQPAELQFLGHVPIFL